VTENLNIYQRLAKVREEVSYIQKDAKVEGYKAITHDVVTAEIRPHLISNGIMVVPRQVFFELRNANKTTKSGTPITVFLGQYEIDFVNIDDPKDRVMVSICATAEDHGDKGPGKCVSYATKTAFLKLFNIETGESDESRQEQKPTPISEEQIVNLREICESKNFPWEATLSRLANKIFNVKKIEDLPKERFEAAQKFLNEQNPNEPKEREPGEE